MWRHIDAPLLWRPLLVAAAFAFAISLGEFGATAIIARPEHPTVPVVIFRLLGLPGALNYGQALALSTILMVVCTAGILAIGLHSMGTYGKLFAEAIESLDMAAIDAVRSVGAGPAPVFFNAVWPSVLPQFVSSHLYVWEFNIRDSTVLGLIGAGGLGLLITEATALFQWGRLATVLIVVIALVVSFDALSRRIRTALA